MPRAVLMFTSLLLAACHSNRPRPTPLSPSAPRLQDEYKRARALPKPIDRCVIYRRLAQDKDFLPHDLARLRAAETCGDVKVGELLAQTLPKYLNEIALDIELNLARDQNDAARDLQLTLEKSKQKLTQAEKLRWLQRAEDRARELKNADALADVAKRRGQVAPRFLSGITETEYLSVALDYRQDRQFAKAREYFERVIANANTKPEEKIAALKGLRLGLKNARRGDDHLDAGDRLVKFIAQALKANPKSKNLRAAAMEAGLYQARAQWTAGRVAEARVTLQALESRWKGQRPLAEVYWLKARMADEIKDFAGVSAWLDRAVLEKPSDRGLRDKILWYAAWNERNQKHWPAAIERLTQIDRDTQDEFLRNRALFWLGQTQMDANQKSAAEATFARVIDTDPLGYYGLLGQRALKRQIKLDLRPKPLGLLPEIPLDGALSEWLIGLEEPGALTPLLDDAAKAYQAQPKQSDEGWFALFQYYAAAGLYAKLFDKLGALTPARRKALLQEHPDLLFPQPFSADVSAASQRFNVPSELIYAIMRQESAFDIHARSPADAFGLLQLLPELGESLGHRYQIAYTQMEDLFNPAINIPLGAAHLQELLKRYQGKKILAIASYNASDSAVQNWVRTRYHGNDLEFIEEIPFEETRAYVRLVSRNAQFYRMINKVPGAFLQ